MIELYEEYLEQIEADAVKEGLGDLRLAREEFHNLTGKFEDGEPWFELRMMMFLDWYLLDRPGPDERTPVERYLDLHAAELSPKETVQLEYLTSTMRSTFEILFTKGSELCLLDLLRGGEWLVHCTMTTVGLSKGDILGARIVFFDGKPSIGRGIVLHPREAHEVINSIIARARQEQFPMGQLCNHLDKMRLKLDRYSNVRISHIYRYPSDALF